MTSRLIGVALSAVLLLATGSGFAAAAATGAGAQPTDGWSPFEPATDSFEGSSLDLRYLNEKVAGQTGFVHVKDGRFILGESGKTVRFWAVNGPPHELTGQALKDCARMLAKRGVNLVRIHGGVFDEAGEPDPKKVARTLEFVRAMKAEGIYTHLSIYFPLWIRPKADTPWLKGYDGNRHPFAALFFNKDFQEQYRKWWVALLKTPDPETGKALVDEPAVAGVEIQNEDSLFFWTFDEKNIPDEQLRILEKRFGDWLTKRHGSIRQALATWKDIKVKRDAPDEGRVGFRPLWSMFNDKTLRDQETAQFLLEVQTGFYRDTSEFLRKLGFKGLVNASNWSTASPEVFGPLEKMSYAVCDFIDRHGYFSCNHKGEAAEWSIRDGHTYSDRSALRFDPEQPGKPKLFVHPAMDPHYDDKPSMISETTWTRPNRYRGEAPLYLAAYGALQGSDAVVHFALDGATWSVKPNYWMQPWTLMSPGMMGQFPAAALLYRQGLLKTGDVVATVELNRGALRRLEGTPLPQDAALDELRLKDLPAGHQPNASKRLDPLLHYAGRTQVRFTDGPGSVRVSQSVKTDHAARKVTSTTGELQLDYEKGVLIVNAPAAQGASGALALAGKIETRDLIISSDMDLLHVIAISLDSLPIADSRRVLLQVMSEEKPTGFETTPLPDGVHKIKSIGRNPWMLRDIRGTISLKGALKQRAVTALDANGYPAQKLPATGSIELLPDKIYYLIEKNP